MTTLSTETAAMAVTLTTLPDAPAEVQRELGAGLVRALGLAPQREVDPDYAASVAAGYVESLDEWAERVLGGGAR